MLAEVLQVEGAMSPLAAFLLALAIGLVIAGLPEYLWEAGERGCMLDTLGEVVTLVLAIVAVLVVPAAIARAWWPEVKRAIGNTIGAVVDLFVMSPEGGEHSRPI